MMRRRSTVVTVGAVLAVLAAGCTTEEPDPPEPTETAGTPVVKYDAIPYDPCWVIDLSEAEALLGPLEYDDYFNAGDDDPDSMESTGMTWCDARFDDGTGQSARLNITIYKEIEPVGTAADQKFGPGDEYSWPYGADARERPEELPPYIELQVDSQWESFEVAQYPEVRNDDFGWDPEGRSLAVQGVFAESNVWVLFDLWRSGTGAPATPEPGPYADLIAELADQVRGQLEVYEGYKGD
jgi:hypothetical protein